jgi:hypothetical protein
LPAYNEELLLHVRPAIQLKYLRFSEDVIDFEGEILGELYPFECLAFVPCEEDGVGGLVILGQQNQASMVTDLVDMRTPKNLEPIVASVAREVRVDFLTLLGQI